MREKMTSDTLFAGSSSRTMFSLVTLGRAGASTADEAALGGLGNRLVGALALAAPLAAAAAADDLCLPSGAANANEELGKLAWQAVAAAGSCRDPLTTAGNASLAPAQEVRDMPCGAILSTTAAAPGATPLTPAMAVDIILQDAGKLALGQAAGSECRGARKRKFATQRSSIKC